MKKQEKANKKLHLNSYIQKTENKYKFQKKIPGHSDIEVQKKDSQLSSDPPKFNHPMP